MLDLKSFPIIARSLVLLAIVGVKDAVPALASTPQPLSHPTYQPVKYQAIEPSMLDDISTKGSPLDQTNDLLRQMIGLAEKFSLQAAETLKSETGQGKSTNAVVNRTLKLQEAAFRTFQNAINSTSSEPLIYYPQARTDSLADRLAAFSSGTEAAYQHMCQARFDDRGYSVAIQATQEFSQSLESGLKGDHAKIGHRPLGQWVAVTHSGGN